MTIDLTQIATAAISLIGVIITAFALPRMRALTAADTHGLLGTAAKTAVYAAQQIFEAEENSEKKNYAVSYTKNVLARRHITISEEEVSAAIEAALKEIKMTAENIW